MCVLTENGHVFIHIRMRNGVTKTMLVNKHLNDWREAHPENFVSDFKSIHDITCYDVATAIHTGISPKFFICLWNCHIVEVSLIERIVSSKERDVTEEEMNINNSDKAENDKVMSNTDNNQENEENKDKQENTSSCEKGTRKSVRSCRTNSKKITDIDISESERKTKKNKGESESDDDSDFVYDSNDVDSKDEEYSLKKSENEEEEEEEENKASKKPTNKNKKRSADEVNESKNKTKQPVKSKSEDIPEIKPLTEHSYNIKDTLIGDDLISYKFEFKYLFKSIRPVFIGSFFNGFVAINRQEFYLYYKGKLLKKILINLPYFPSSAPNCSSINNVIGVVIACGSCVWYAHMEITEDGSNVKILSSGSINIGAVVVSAQYMMDYLGILIMTEDGRIDVYKLIVDEGNLLKPVLSYSRQHFNISNKSCVNALLKTHSLHPISGTVPISESPNEALKSVSKFIILSSNPVPCRHRLYRFYKLQELSAIWEELLAPVNETWRVNEYACYTRIELQNTKSKMYSKFAENMRKAAEKKVSDNQPLKKKRRQTKSLSVESLGIGISTDNLADLDESEKPTNSIYNANGTAEERLEHVMSLDTMICPPIFDVDEDEFTIMPPNECKVCGFMCSISDEKQIINSEHYKGFIYCPRCMSVMSCVLCKDYL